MYDIGVPEIKCTQRSVDVDSISIRYYAPQKCEAYQNICPPSFCIPHLGQRVTFGYVPFILCRYTFPAKHSFYNDYKQTYQFVPFHPNRNKNATVHGVLLTSLPPPQHELNSSYGSLIISVPYYVEQIRSQSWVIRAIFRCNQMYRLLSALFLRLRYR